MVESFTFYIDFEKPNARVGKSKKKLAMFPGTFEVPVNLQFPMTFWELLVAFRTH